MTGSNFLNKFKPENQTLCTADLERCYMGNAPALGAVGRAFGNNVAEFWLSVQLIDLSEFAGNRVKLTTEQADAAAKVIKAEYGYMTVTQLMHFFQMFKGGKYGKFYGAVDPITITEALRQYAGERWDIIRKYEAQAEEKRKAREREAHDAEVGKLRDALAVSHMTIEERLALLPTGLTLDEIAEIGWLFRM